MATREHIVYTCDRCKCETLAPMSQDGQRQVWPDSWFLVVTQCYGRIERHLCPRCHTEFVIWMRG
jgi:hypothetical protein